MAGGGGGGIDRPLNGGEFLLSLLQRSHQPQPPVPAPPQSHPLDPAVAAMGPTIPLSYNGHDHLPNWSPSPPYPPNFFLQGFPQNPFPGNNFPRNNFFTAEDVQNSMYHQKHEDKLVFGNFPPQLQNHVASLNGNFTDMPSSSSNVDNLLRNQADNSRERELGFRDRGFGGYAGNQESNSKIDSFTSRTNYVHSHDEVSRTLPGHRNPPPGFPSKPGGGGGGNWDHADIRRRGSVNNVSSVSNGDERIRRGLHEGDGRVHGNFGLSGQLDCPGPPAGSKLWSASASEIEDSMLDLHRGTNDHKKNYGTVRVERVRKDDAYDQGDQELEELSEQLMGSLGLENGIDDTDNKKKHRKKWDKDARADTRGQHMLNQRMRNFKRLMDCRSDINRLNVPFLAIYESLIPAEEEKAKQKKLLTLLERLVNKEWPQAQLYIYGSCANSFGVSRSDIDICLAINDPDINKSDILLKLADILESDNLQNVQALTHARVPIVKLMDPETGLSCDICINNVLAVVNTKLLRDYARIDVRLRQLAFIIKHWAKSRGVNETYHGTLSSYAYVLMCIHFLQLRRPAILPCLQGMERTYSVTIDNVECAYFDKVNELADFGACNGESISQLVWAFFNYWAYSHDYANSVISVRTGSTLSKRAKDWTRRIGNDRHLICIEDPFETSHDLGRVVDKNSIRVLREEFERAADILQNNPNPCEALFEPYVRI